MSSAVSTATHTGSWTDTPYAGSGGFAIPRADPVDPRDDLSPDARGSTLWNGWTALWNGDLSLASGLITDDFQIHFGAEHAGADDIRGAAAFAVFVDWFRSRFRSPHFRADLSPLIQLTEVDGIRSGRVAGRWITTHLDPTGRERTKGGIDILRVAGDRIAEAWSVTGTRDLPLPPV